MSCLFGNDLEGLIPRRFHSRGGYFFGLLRITGLVEGNEIRTGGSGP
jgi:hypothetical protein